MMSALPYAICMRAKRSVSSRWKARNASVITVINDIPLGHKVGLRDMPVGHKLMKYGRPIGQVVKPTAKGAHVHTHNLKTTRWSLDEFAAPDIVTRPAERLALGGKKPEEMKLLGYRRENGRYRHPQPRGHPAAGRHLQRRGRGRVVPDQGHHGAAAPLRPSAVR